MVKQSCIFGWQINNLYKDHHMGNHGMPVPSKWGSRILEIYCWVGLENFDCGRVVSVMGIIHSNML